MSERLQYYHVSGNHRAAHHNHSIVLYDNAFIYYHEFCLHNHDDDVNNIQLTAYDFFDHHNNGPACRLRPSFN